MPTLFYGICNELSIALPEDVSESHPTVFRVKYLKQFSADGLCFFLISFYVTKTIKEVLHYLRHVAVVGQCEVFACDRQACICLYFAVCVY